MNESYNDKLRGIDVDQIGNMQSAITSYQSDVQKVLDKIISKKEMYRQAFAGQSQIDNISSYVDEGIDRIHKVMANLSKFSAALDQIKANYSRQSDEVGQAAQAAVGDYQDKEKLTTATGVMGFDENTTTGQ